MKTKQRRTYGIDHLDSTLRNAQRVSGTPHFWSNAQSTWDNRRICECAALQKRQFDGLLHRGRIGVSIFARRCLHGLRRLGAVFHVYDRLHFDRNPRRYSVEAGNHFRDSWDTRADAGVYDLWILGRNGFYRYFRDDIDFQIQHRNARPKVGIHYKTDDRTIGLILINASTVEAHFKIVSNYYSDKTTRILRVVAGGIEDHHFYIGSQYDWYDFSATVSGIPNYLRRIVGRMETGHHGISDPVWAIELRVLGDSERRYSAVQLSRKNRY